MRDLGLSSRKFKSILFGKPTDSMPVMMTQEPGVARAFGLSLEELLYAHTVLPYALAFMSADTRAAITRALFDESGRTYATPPLVGSSTKFISHLQFCPRCVTEDSERYGIAYWHREHQLPGVRFCLPHGAVLRVSDLRVGRPREMVLPHEVGGSRELPAVVPHRVGMRIARLSCDAMRGKVPVRSWATHYRIRAAELGYGYDMKLLAGSLLASDLRTFYGARCLAAFGLDFDPQTRRTHWPASMIRGGNKNATPLRHVLLNVFLDCCRGASKPVPDLFLRPQVKQFDWAAREREVLRRLEELRAKYQAEGGRVGLRELSAQVSGPHYLWTAGVRNKMPAVSAWVKAFKASDLSMKKTGGRRKRRKG
jgi:hypothetical protein